MYTNKAVNNISDAISDVLLPKFDKYIKNRKNDASIKKEIDLEVSHIDDLEDTILEMTNGLSFSGGDHIKVGEYWFYYNEEQDAFLYSDNKKSSATDTVYYRNGLNSSWMANNGICTRIKAIVSTLEPVSFEDALTIVEKQINFAEFISKPEKN